MYAIFWDNIYFNYSLWSVWVYPWATYFNRTEPRNRLNEIRLIRVLCFLRKNRHRMPPIHAFETVYHFGLVLQGIDQCHVLPAKQISVSAVHVNYTSVVSVWNFRIDVKWKIRSSSKNYFPLRFKCWWFQNFSFWEGTTNPEKGVECKTCDGINLPYGLVFDREKKQQQQHQVNIYRFAKLNMSFLSLAEFNLEH